LNPFANEKKELMPIFLVLLASTVLIISQNPSAFAFHTYEGKFVEQTSTPLEIFLVGDKLIISGHVTTPNLQTPVTIQVFHEGNLVDIVHRLVDQDGDFNHVFIVQGQLWKNDGLYTVSATHGAYKTGETNFYFDSKSDTTPKNLEPIVDGVTVCHYPLGNLDNPHTLRISSNALQTHLSHGDLVGKCDTKSNQSIVLNNPNDSTPQETTIITQNYSTQNDDRLDGLIEENKKLREELERQGSQIDSINEQAGFFDKFMTPVMNLFSSFFSGNSEFVSLAYENGSEITIIDVQDAFSDFNELHDDIKMMNAIKILGFDARDVNILNAHDEKLMIPNSGGVQNGAKKAGERVAVYLQNNGAKNVTVSELRYAGYVYNYTAQSSLDAYNGTAPAQGQYVILSKSPNTLLNSTEPVLQSGVKATIILDLKHDIKFGLGTQFRLVTTDGNMLVHTVYHGLNSD